MIEQLSHGTTVVDPRVRRFVTPTRVVWQSEAPQAPQNSEKLLAPTSDQAFLNPVEPCRLVSGSALVLDFGRELHGGIQIISAGMGDRSLAAVRIRTGESVSEVMGEPNNDHAVHDQQCRLPRWGTYEYGNTAFRFLRIDLLEEDCTVEVLAVRAIELMRDDPYLGSFRCSDERLNRIWDTGAYTVHLCMQEYLWDGAKRDRLVWLGDMHPETTVVSYVFGAHPIVPASLDFVRDRTPDTDSMNGISSYSLWWVLIQHSWFLHHGDRDYLENQRTYLVGLLGRLLAQIDEQGSEKLSEWRFLDWPSGDNEVAKHAGLHALLIMGLNAGAELCATLGEDDMRAQCLAGVERMRAHMPALEGINKQASSLLALSGMQDADAINRTVLAQDPLHGLSTFYGYYVLQARALAGDYAGALDVIRNYWGGMLDLGATTFWEHFELSWMENAGRIDEIVPPGKVDVHADCGAYCFEGIRHSFCHGWAAGPTAWLSEHILGFKPLTPGSTTLQVRPHLEDLDFAEGSYPTPLGVVTVRHTKTASGEVETVIVAPAGITIVR